MTVCLRCHRPLKRPTESGLGPVCAKAPTPEVCRDLFGYDIERAAVGAMARVLESILMNTKAQQAEIRRGFIQARARLGVALQ